MTWNELASLFAAVLRDPAWQAAGVFLTLTLVAGGALLRWNRRQRMWYRVRVNAPIVSVSPKYAGRVAVSVDGAVLRAPRLLIVDVSNSGGGPIARADFDGPLSVSTGEARIVTAEVMESRPDDLRVQIDVREDVVEVQPLLLNQRDCFSLCLILDGIPTVSLSGRIQGIRSIGNPVTRFGICATITFLLLGISGLVMAIVEAIAETSKGTPPPPFLAWLIICIVSLGTSAYVSRELLPRENI